METARNRAHWPARKTTLEEMSREFGDEFLGAFAVSRGFEEAVLLTDEVLRFKGLDPRKVVLDRNVSRIIRP